LIAVVARSNKNIAAKKSNVIGEFMGCSI